MTVKITDIGSMTGLAEWQVRLAGVKVDRESDNEYEKTSTIGGYQISREVQQVEQVGRTECSGRRSIRGRPEW